MKIFIFALLILSLNVEGLFSQDKPLDEGRAYKAVADFISREKTYEAVKLLPLVSKRHKETLLMISIANQDVTMGALLIDEYKVDPNCMGEEEFSDLHALDFAAECASRPMVEMLILREKGSVPNGVKISVTDCTLIEDNLECGSLLPLCRSAACCRRIGKGDRDGSKLPNSKAEASLRTPYRSFATNIILKCPYLNAIRDSS